MRRLTWVEVDGSDGLAFRAYAGSARPVAEVWHSRWPPFPGAWLAEVDGVRVGGSYANRQLAQRSAQYVWNRSQRR